MIPAGLERDLLRRTGTGLELFADGSNPGELHVRFALVPSLDDVKLAADRIRKAF